MRTTHKLVIAATLALAPAPAAFAFPPSRSHPEVGPAGGQKAVQVSPAGSADHVSRTLLRPALEAGHAAPTMPLPPASSPVPLQ